MHMHTYREIIDAWPTIQRQENDHNFTEGEEREIEKTKHTEILNYYNVLVQSEEEFRHLLQEVALYILSVLHNTQLHVCGKVYL